MMRMTTTMTITTKTQLEIIAAFADPEIDDDGDND